MFVHNPHNGQKCTYNATFPPPFPRTHSVVIHMLAVMITVCDAPKEPVREGGTSERGGSEHKPIASAWGASAISRKAARRAGKLAINCVRAS